MNDVMEWARYEFGHDSRLEQLDLLRDVLSSDQLGVFFGRFVRELEARTSAYVRCRESVAAPSGTAALQLILGALGIGPGDEVVIPEFGWVSVGGAVRATGADVRVAPMDRTLSPGWDDIRPRLGKRTRAVVIAHPRGVPALATPHVAAGVSEAGIHLIEDCAQAWGVRLAGSHVGNSGTAAFFSTQAYKLVSTGEGGLVASSDADLVRRVRVLQGDTRVRSDVPAWRLALRMTELQAAVALPQLQRLDALIDRLTVLQERVVPILLTHDDIADVIPDQEMRSLDGFETNGSFVVAWCVSCAAAARTRRRLREAGLRVSQGTDDDLHFSRSWPTDTTTSRVDLRTLVEIPIPDVGLEDHGAFLDVLSTALSS